VAAFGPGGAVDRRTALAWMVAASATVLAGCRGTGTGDELPAGLALYDQLLVKRSDRTGYAGRVGPDRLVWYTGAGWAYVDAATVWVKPDLAVDRYLAVDAAAVRTDHRLPDPVAVRVLVGLDGGGGAADGTDPTDTVSALAGEAVTVRSSSTSDRTAEIGCDTPTGPVTLTLFSGGRVRDTWPTPANTTTVGLDHPEVAAALRPLRRIG
jgi:hypothetical protein